MNKVSTEVHVRKRNYKISSKNLPRTHQYKETKWKRKKKYRLSREISLFMQNKLSKCTYVKVSGTLSPLVK